MEKEMVNLTIDNQKVTVPKGTTILEAAKKQELIFQLYVS